MQYKVSELIGPLLDAAVGMAAGRVVSKGVGDFHFVDGLLAGGVSEYGPDPNADYSPSIAWHDGGPIIERERPHDLRACVGPVGWYVRSRHAPCDGDQFYGETMLIAAMRAYVASKYGDVVDLP